MENVIDKPPKEIFKIFHFLNKKKYDLYSEEGKRRFYIFEENLRKIKKHNTDPLKTYNLGLTEYTDWSEEEWARRNAKRPEIKNASINSVTHPTRGAAYTPIDWRKKGINFPVKKDNGYDCRNTFAIAHSYVFEAWYYLNYGTYKAISPQNLIDCTTSWDCTTYLGPNWDIDYDFLYVNGMFEESAYPFTGTKKACNSYIVNTGIKIAPKKWEFPISGNYDTETIYRTLNRGPFFFCFSQSVPFMYTGGIISDYGSSILCGFSNCYYDSGMLVGYGIDPLGIEFWIAKTTLGANWGESGYIRFKRMDDRQNYGLNCLYLRPGLDSLDNY
jgi:hypothetical protein